VNRNRRTQDTVCLYVQGVSVLSSQALRFEIDFVNNDIQALLKVTMLTLTVFNIN
jgi:hypothetical protein